MFGYGVLIRVFEPNREEVTIIWRNFHKLYSLSNIIKMAKSRKDEMGGWKM
jgi:hypothetical protein